MTTRTLAALLLLATGFAAAGCDNGGNEADRVGVAAECAVDEDCPVIACETEPCPVLECLTQFAGGYCGIADCTADLDCPDGSACVAHDDGRNYCFRLCADKPECNLNRSGDVEANCSASVEFLAPQTLKACVPPSSGI